MAKELASKIVDKPIVNGDSAYTTNADSMPRPYGPVADSLEQRAEWTAEFFRRAFARPEFVGWRCCGLIDASNLVPRNQDRQRSGLLDGCGEPYPALKKNDIGLLGGDVRDCGTQALSCYLRLPQTPAAANLQVACPPAVPVFPESRARRDASRLVFADLTRSVLERLPQSRGIPLPDTIRMAWNR